MAIKIGQEKCSKCDEIDDGIVLYPGRYRLMATYNSPIYSGLTFAYPDLIIDIPHEYSFICYHCINELFLKKQKSLERQK